MPLSKTAKKGLLFGIGLPAIIVAGLLGAGVLGAGLFFLLANPLGLVAGSALLVLPGAISIAIGGLVLATALLLTAAAVTTIITSRIKNIKKKRDDDLQKDTFSAEPISEEDFTSAEEEKEELVFPQNWDQITREIINKEKTVNSSGNKSSEYPWNKNARYQRLLGNAAEHSQDESSKKAYLEWAKNIAEEEKWGETHSEDWEAELKKNWGVGGAPAEVPPSSDNKPSGRDDSDGYSAETHKAAMEKFSKNNKISFLQDDLDEDPNQKSPFEVRAIKT